MRTKVLLAPGLSTSTMLTPRVILKVSRKAVLRVASLPPHYVLY